MKRRITHFSLLALMMLQLVGCGAGTDEVQGDAVQGENGLISESVLDASEIAALGYRDNSMDVYSSIINNPLRVEEPEGAIVGGGSNVFLGNSRAFYFKKHLFVNYQECWDEITYVTTDGKSESVKREMENQIWSIGPVLDTDHYIIQHVTRQEDEDIVYSNFIAEMDENHEVLREIPVSFLDGNELKVVDMVMDKSGYIHMSYFDFSGEEYRYYIASSEGELLVDYSFKGYHVNRLVPLYDGRVALDMEKDFEEGQKIENKQHILQYLDMESGETVTLAELTETSSNTYHSITLRDGNTLLYANDEGVYSSDLSGNNPELLYRWSNHGITVSDIPVMQSTGERIDLIYESSGDMNYLCIKPTTEQVEIIEITMAVPSAMKPIYQTVVAEFNKKYPSCHIELKTNYEETALLTELIAGNGPVLIHTALTGFENQEELWEPLDEVIEQLGITEQLIPSVMELGKINGTLYGIVTDFYLETVVTGEKNLKEWDYDTFLKYIQENPDLEAVVNSYDLKDDAVRFIQNFFVHGLEDNYLLDVESCTTYFDSEEFREILKTAEKYSVRNDYIYPGSLLDEGKVLCNMLTIEKPEQVALYRICYGEDINYIGYTTKDGAKHFLNSRLPIVIRKTATKEEKEIACAFISLLLSYDCQIKMSKGANFALSVRKDVLEEQINSVNGNSLPYASGFEQIELGDRVNNALDAGTLHDLIGKAIPRKYFPGELNSILNEELTQYFSGAITEEVLIDHLEKRVELYLEERQ